MQDESQKNLQSGRAFLESHKNEAGMVTLPSGLQYKVITEGKGPVPKASDIVTVHYRGTLVDGMEFDSTYGREPAQFRVNQVIPGWTEALQLMKQGSKWQLVIPADLAYGPRGAGPIGPNSTLLFDVELLSIGEPSAAQEATSTPDTAASKGSAEPKAKK
jgi:FKBP-type peptidyl-prolyl cis-trans isomerase